jgi:hypothetical protein
MRRSIGVVHQSPELLTKISATMMRLLNVLDVRVIYIVMHALKKV